METYFIKMADREEGSYTETQVSQLFADGRVDRNTLCRPGADGVWKTIDEYLPMLKYGTQLPAPTAGPATTIRDAQFAPNTSPIGDSAGFRVAIMDIDVPFVSLLKLTFKWMAAATIVGLCFGLVWLLFSFLFLGGLFSAFHRP